MNENLSTGARKAIQWIKSYHLMGLDGKLVSFDTEGSLSTISVIGFAVTTTEAHVIPFLDAQGHSLWTEEEEVEIWQATKELLEDASVKKVMQYFPSDAFILAWSYGIVIEGLEHDVMVEGWEAQPELEKGLASLASLYTREPFWKSKENYSNRLAYVCSRDCMLTLEVHQVLQRILKEPQKVHYRFNVENLPNTLYQMLEGLPFDKAQARDDLKALYQSIYETQYEIDRAAFEAIQQGSGGVGKRPRREMESAPTGPTSEIDKAAWEAVTTTAGVDVSNSSTNTSLSHSCPRSARLAEWFGAIGTVNTNLCVPRLVCNTESSMRSDPILALATQAFAAARHSEKVEVVEERWQPMRWGVKAKRWVKNGKLITVRPAPYEFIEQDTEPAQSSDRWLKPSPRIVEVNRPVPIDSWETLERFCKESCKGELKRVRKLVGWLEKLYEARDKISEPVADGLPIDWEATRRTFFGELSSLLKIAINSNANNQGGDTQWLLHECWGLPRKLKKVVRVVEEGEEEDPRLTTDNSMLLTLWARCQQPKWAEWRKHSKLRGDDLLDWLKESSRRLKLVLRMRKLVKERCYLDVATDSDGRVRYGLNLVQAATGRFAAYGSPTGKSKLNPQTVGKKHRHLYTYDP